LFSFQNQTKVQLWWILTNFGKYQVFFFFNFLFLSFWPSCPTNLWDTNVTGLFLIYRTIHTHIHTQPCDMIHIIDTCTDCIPLL
jgi:hypothetical protein